MGGVHDDHQRLALGLLRVGIDIEDAFLPQRFSIRPFDAHGD